MIKFFTIIFVFCLSLGAIAQTNSGNFLIEGSAGLSSKSTDNPVYTPEININNQSISSNFESKLNLMGGIFLADDFMFGLGISYSYYETVNKYEETEVSNFYSSKNVWNRIALKPSFRYYVGKTGIWSQVAYSYGSTEAIEYYKYNEDNSWERAPQGVYRDGSLSYGVGYALFLSEFVSLNPNFGYSIKTNFLDNHKLKSFNFNLSLAIHL